MKRLIFISIFLLNFNLGFTQNKIFLPSEDGWVTVVEFSDWIEDNSDNYLGQYDYYYSLINDKGENEGGDGYIETIQLQKIAGKINAFRLLNVEGWDDVQKDTLHNVYIDKNILKSDRPDLKFVTLKYKDKKKKIKKVSGILDLDVEKMDYFLEKVKNSAQGKVK